MKLNRQRGVRQRQRERERWCEKAEREKILIVILLRALITKYNSSSKNNIDMKTATRGRRIRRRRRRATTTAENVASVREMATVHKLLLYEQPAKLSSPARKKLKGDGVGEKERHRERR